MQPSMAAMVPGGCIEVDQAECGAVPTPSPGGGSSISFPSWMDGPTEITVRVKEPTELKPYAGGADVLIEQANINVTDPQTGQLVWAQTARGKTDQLGNYVWTGTAPIPTAAYRFRVSISIPGGTPKVVEVPARTAFASSAGNGELSKSEIVASVCPPNIDPLVCAVAEAKLDWQAIYDDQLAAWQEPNVAGNAARHAAWMAAFFVPLKHAALSAHIDVFRYWLGDVEILPKDWPDLIKNYEQALGVFSAIPFPRWTGIEDYFQSCASVIPIGLGKNAERYGFLSPRLYVKRFSDYFPRTDKQINKDMAAAYSVGLQAIMACIKRKIEEKIEETKRSMRIFAILSFFVVLVNFPLLMALGVPGIAMIATETYDLVHVMGGGEPLGVGVTAALAAASLAAGSVDLVTAALGPIIRGLLGDMDPIAAQALNMILPQFISLTATTVSSLASNSVATGSNLIANGASSFLDLSGIGGAIAVMAIKAIASLPKMFAARALEDLQHALAGAESAAKDVIAFVAGEEVSPTFKPFLIWVVEALGLVELVDQAIDTFLDQFQQAMQVGQEQGGGVAVVAEEGGGGPAIVPTNAEGVPTDVNGVPLPGGVAPLSPPTGGGNIPGVPNPPTPPPPTTTNTPGMEGAVGLTTTGAAVGVSGATLALLLVTGAVS